MITCTIGNLEDVFISCINSKFIIYAMISNVMNSTIEESF